MSVIDHKMIEEISALKQKIKKLEESLRESESLQHTLLALRESEQMFKDLSEKSIAGIYLIQDGMFKYVNLQLARMFGYEIDEMIASISVKDVVYPEDWPVVQKNMVKRLSGEVESFNYLIRIITKSKQIREVDLYSSRAMYRGRPAIIGTCLDVTDRKRAEADVLKYSLNLGERVKELNCLYAISETVRREDISQDAILRECAALLARAYLFPEIAACCITWGDREYITKGFRRTAWMQSQPITVHGRHAGTIEVCYLEEKSEEYEGPFLAEERKLLGSVANLIGRSTERKESERILDESRQQFQRLVETMHDWVWEIDPDGRFTYVSPQVRNILGYNPEEILGKTPFDLMSRKDARRLAEAFELLMKERSPIVELENINIHKNGRQVILETNGLPFYDPAGNFKGYRGTDCDITSRKAAEKALRESEIKHRAIFEHANDAIFLIHHDKFIDCNPKTLEMFRCEREQIIGHAAYEFSPPCQPDGNNSKDLAIVKINKALQGEAQRFEWVHCHYDRTPFNAEISLNPVELDGELYIQAVVRDISDRKRIEMEREGLIDDLKDALSQVKVLSGLLPVCALCKKIRNDKGKWEQMETYIRDRSDATFTHGYCPECMERLRAEIKSKK